MRHDCGGDTRTPLLLGDEAVVRGGALHQARSRGRAIVVTGRLAVCYDGRGHHVGLLDLRRSMGGRERERGSPADFR